MSGGEPRGDAPDAARFFTSGPGGALLDRNGDGFPDALGARIVVAGAPSPEEWVELVHLAARLGLETGGLDFPLAVPDGASLPPAALPLRFVPAGQPEDEGAMKGGPVVRGAAGARALWRAGLDGAAEAGGPGEPAAESPAAPALDLAGLYDLGGLLADDDGDEFPDRARVCFVVPPDLPRDAGCALLDLAARLGLESAGLRIPLAAPAGAGRPADAVPVFLAVAPALPDDLASETPPDLPALEAGEGLCAALTIPGGGPALLVTGDAAGLTAALRDLAATWPCLRAWGPDVATAADLADEVASLAHGEGPAGRAALLAADLARLPAGASGAVRLLTDDPAVADAAARAGVPFPVTPAPDDLLAFADEWADEWEIERARRLVRERVLPALDPAAPADLLVMVSEPAEIRRDLARELAALLPAGSTVAVLSAFKPGLCWLREVVAPAWAARGDVARVELRFRPFVAPESARHLDLRIRWLQELFPGDELLAAALGLPLAAVTLAEAPDSDAAYSAHAYDAAGDEVDARDFTPRAYPRPYLDAAPAEGLVMATTGSVVARQGGRVLVDEALPTDLDRFWDYYQGTVLPRVRATIAAATGGAPTAAAQPFFAALDVEVWCSEPDEPLGIREEAVSSAEALHEDIYFATLDDIAALGRAPAPSGTLDAPAEEEPLDAPGPVRPFVHVQPGAGPRARIALRRRPRNLAALVQTDEDGIATRTPLGRLPTGPRPRARVRWATWRAGRPSVARLGLALDGAGERAASVLRHVADQGSPGGADAIALDIALPDAQEGIALALPAPVVGYRAAGGAAADGAAMPLDVVIGEDELPPLLGRLATLPGVAARRVGRSFEGRPIDAVEVVAPPGAVVWSRVKASLYKPTLLVVGRHHANEVASTPAALRLAELLATDPAYRPLLDRVNVALLPLENADGAALHYAMQREHPTWKLHAARYNAVGLEFSREFFAPDTPYGEARVRPLLWRRWRPDVVADNHGVPSHEWNQLFSGFNSPPRFGVSYWLVQALIYGILRYRDEPAYRAFGEALRDRVSAAIAADGEILAANRVLRERYTTWGHAWLPENFPAAFYNDMQWYFGPRPEGWRARSRQPANYERVTTANWVTEVPDETAQGPYLALVARAHLTANLATLRLLADLAPPVERRVAAGPAGVQVTLRRRRPL